MLIHACMYKNAHTHACAHTHRNAHGNTGHKIHTHTSHKVRIFLLYTNTNSFFRFLQSF